MLKWHDLLPEESIHFGDFKWKFTHINLKDEVNLSPLLSLSLSLSLSFRSRWLCPKVLVKSSALCSASDAIWDTTNV